MQQLDEHYMALAIEQAKLGALNNEVPIGALLVHNNKIIAKAFNQTIAHCDATQHAEMAVIREASQLLQNHRLSNTTLYVTLEPCLMCFGAIVQARIDRVVYAANDNRFSVVYPLSELRSKIKTNHWPLVESNVLADESTAIIRDFFRQKRSK